MMKNKVLIKLTVIELDQSFDLFIPVNELIWKIKKLIVKSVSDLSGINMNSGSGHVLMNAENNTIYNNNEIVIDTDIRNGSELLLFIRK